MTELDSHQNGDVANSKRETRTLGIDYGRKRTGVAISDPLGITAQPLPTISTSSADALIAEIARIVSERNVSRVVVGLPLSKDGSLGTSGKKVMEFVRKLQQGLPCTVVTEDERLTTAMADKALAAVGEGPKTRKKKVDRVAAQLILQTYLDKTPRSRGGI